MIKIVKYLTLKEWLMVLASVLFIITQVWLELIILDYMSEITTLVQTPGSAMSDIWRAGSMMLLATLGSLIAAIVVGYFAAIIGSRFSTRLRSLLFNKVDSLSMERLKDC